MTRHKHADLMIAYANDTTTSLQWRPSDDHVWVDCATPGFNPNLEYRIKPKPKVKKWRWVFASRDESVRLTTYYYNNSTELCNANPGARAIMHIPETEIEVDAD